jgi:hypothetical protein
LQPVTLVQLMSQPADRQLKMPQDWVFRHSQKEPLQ